ncbi:MAG TPA: transposase [Candidatus Melainabacteria bacterium]|nr:transposase [Candidatus Melainabacteria bacterium]
MEQNKKKKFNQEFKDSAVRLVEGGKSAAQVARELGLPAWQVQTWVRNSRKHSTATVNGVNLLEENKRLKKDLARLQEEAEILKKAAKFFAQLQE